MAEKPSVRMSVRAVVENTLHEQDLSPAAGTARRMREGAAAHKARQAGETARGEGYRAEVALSAEYETDTLILRVTGRADGLFVDENGTTVVEEIKLGIPGMPLIPAHMAQAALYGHMFCAGEGMGAVRLCVLYVDAQGCPLERYETERDAASLEAEFACFCEAAAAWEMEKLTRRASRDASLQALAFPFDTYRAGQKRFAQNVFVAIRERKRLFAQAPTGIGKTMAALYPALMAIREGKCARALFLTARVTGRKSAVDALSVLCSRGATLLAAEIAAKDKVCPQEMRDCRPEVCPYAKGFYDRLPAALREAVRTGGVYDRARTADLAARHELCPFELSLELARLSDVVIGDYNYVYDPFVAIETLLQAPGGACLLVDEAHQLASRVRDAYSGEVSLDALREIRRECGKAHGRKGDLYRALTGAIAALKACAQTEDFTAGRLDEPPKALCSDMQAVLDCAGAQLAGGGSAASLAAFQLAAAFTLAAGRFDARYAALAEGGEKHARLLLCCLDASTEILAASKKARGTVYFSATLAPFDAARRMLGSEDGDACLALVSPFDPAHLRARVAPIDIRYAAREKTAPLVAQEIAAQLKKTRGHTLAFFPSYAYMERIYELVLGEEGLSDIAFDRERRGLSEDAKNALLGAFDEQGEQRRALFAVLGGAFSEGIDLPGKRLESVIVVSTGLPQPDMQVRAMQAYYDGVGEDGFFLAMTLPGMIRVIQAAGRLIRTDEDEGDLLLIDSRFHHAQIRRLLGGTLAGDALGLQP